jgi:hypothetical protein
LAPVSCMFGRLLVCQLALGKLAVSVALGIGTTAHGQNPQNDSDEAVPAAGHRYAELVAEDRPVAYWRFEDASGAAERHPAQADAGTWLPTEIKGSVKLEVAGPRSPKFPLFDSGNQAAWFEKPASLRFDDPGADSPLDFAAGDTITLEAWVAPTKLGGGQQVYVVGKGRTGNKGFPADNHNWALRLAGQEGSCRLSFLFRDADNRRGQSDDWHRWTSDAGFAADGNWHHIAVSYTFGQGDSLRGYVDGKLSPGAWDYGGKTDEAPVVDDDQIWIGSALANNAGNSFAGGIDEVAIYRTALSAERIAARWQVVLPKPYITNVPVPADQVLVEVLEGLPDQWNWDFIPPEPSERFTQQTLAMVEAPKKYNAHGVQVDRSSPYVLWAHAEIDVPAGKQRWLLRSRSSARLYVDDELVTETPFPSGKTDGHNPWEPVVSKVSPNIRPLQPGDAESVAELELPAAGKHRVRLEVFVGGKKRRPELGETSVSLAPAGSDDFWVLGFEGLSLADGADSPRRFPLTDEGWHTFERAQRAELVVINRARRRAASTEYAKYWQRRHDFAREYLKTLESADDNSPNSPHASIDAFAAESLAAAGIEAAPPIDDHAFVRRIYLDTIGIPPSASEVAAFVADQTADKRSRLIDRLLEHPGWADNWVGYWQDVLAENPNIVNPTLNNTGPFRWWIHESLLDNKPLDRFATELILMEGSPRYGGPAGFEMATENDAPLAAKAQNISLAFLAFDMRCARCHDAPAHRFMQEDLFNLAAMLHRGEQTLPKSSTIPGDDAAHASLLVNVTLKPGQKIAPRWPFDKDFAGVIPPEHLFDPKDTREELAFRITSPQNPRFARVMVNRLWQRYFGRGIVEPVDDWETATPAHPALLDWLAAELVSHDYDQKHIARLIFNSAAYQRTPTSDVERATKLAAPLRRRMTAEQVLDSLMAASGKELHVEEMNIDPVGSRLEVSSINLGRPERAWQFTTMGNERDRPSLSLPAAQTAVSLLEAFGWRASRQDPLTVREEEPTVLQPAVVANGVFGRRAAQFSEDSIFVELALMAKSPEEFVDVAASQILSRTPTADERALFVELLAEGWEHRATGSPAGPKPGWPARDGVSWSNHLQSESNEIRLAWQKQVEKGDPPTTLLTADWRERAEDVVWTLFNSPEFVWLP